MAIQQSAQDKPARPTTQELEQDLAKLIERFDEAFLSSSPSDELDELHLAIKCLQSTLIGRYAMENFPPLPAPLEAQLRTITDYDGS